MATCHVHLYSIIVMKTTTVCTVLYYHSVSVLELAKGPNSMKLFQTEKAEKIWSLAQIWAAANGLDTPGVG